MAEPPTEEHRTAEPATGDPLAGACELVTSLAGEDAAAWETAGRIPAEPLRRLGEQGLLCAQVPAEHGGRGADSLENGRFTAHVGALSGSLRSVLTSQGMAAWTIARLGDRDQRAAQLPGLTGGSLAAVAFTEPGAGSDLAAMATTMTADGGDIVVTGRKAWVTAAAYADFLVVFGRSGDGAGAVVVPVAAPGVRVEPIGDPLGCRAAGHANVRLESVRVPRSNLLGGAGQPLPLIVATALGYGRISVAWGCVGILRCCLRAASGHARARRQFGRSLADHQLVARHLAELYAAEQVSTRVCEHASRCWDARSADMVAATVLAKHVSASHAARGAAAAVQVMGSAGARDAHPVARAYRDAKLMELIEGSSEISQLMLARYALQADDQPVNDLQAE